MGDNDQNTAQINQSSNEKPQGYGTNTIQKSQSDQNSKPIGYGTSTLEYAEPANSPDHVTIITNININNKTGD